MSAARHLAQARAALVEGRPGDCALALAAFEAAIERQPPSPETLARVRQDLGVLGRLTRAALDGVAEARAQLARALREVRR